MKNKLWATIESKLNEYFASLNATSAAKPDTKAANDKLIADFRAELDAGKAANEAQEKSVTDLTAKVADLTKQLEAKDKVIGERDTKIKDLEAAAKSANEIAADMVASIGIDPSTLPKAGAKKDDKDAGKSLNAQWRELQATDSVKAAAFYAEHSKKPEFWKA